MLSKNHSRLPKESTNLWEQNQIFSKTQQEQNQYSCVCFKTLRLTGQRIRSGNNTRVLSVFGWGYTAQQFMAGLCFPCAWNPCPKPSVVSEWVRMESADTSWAITWPCQLCLWQIPAAKFQVLLAHQPGWEGGRDPDGCGSRGSWQPWDHHEHSSALCGSDSLVFLTSKMPSDVQGFILQDAVAKMC